MPATGALIGTPASISESVAPHTVAIDDEPFDSSVSETTRSVYGKLLAPAAAPSAIARSASVPWPDLAPARAAQRPRLAHRERREVVVQDRSASS